MTACKFVDYSLPYIKFLFHFEGHVPCVKLLISKGAKLNASDRQNGTPLHAACVAYKVNLDCILSLIQAGTIINV